MSEHTSSPKIHTLLGNNNILLIVPDGLCGTGSPKKKFLTEFGLHLAKQLGCYAVINNKYKKSILNFFDVKAIKVRKKVTESYLLQIKRFKDEISENNLIPLILILQSEEIKDQKANQILFGYGQGERGVTERPHRPTISPSILAKYRVALEDKYFKTDIAPTDSHFCGRDSHHINQLFRQKNYVEGFYDPTVRSLLLTLSPDIITEEGQTQIAATALAKAFMQYQQEMALVRKVKVDDIDIETNDDLQYIFRIHNDSRYNELARESYIDELSASIARNGLLHPLVLLQKDDGRYKILCGFRRFQAIKKIPQRWVEAKVFQEQDFSTEDFFNISLAENTKRRNLNPVEIGNFLESASDTMGLNNTMLAEQFGEALGIGTPGQKKVSHSTIHKYRKVNRLRSRRESPEIINDVINENLAFSIVSEVLAPIKSPKDRDSLYLEIIKPLSPTRPQLLKIISLLKTHPKGMGAAIDSKPVQGIIAKAMESKQKASTFIKLHQNLAKPDQTRKDQDFTEKISKIRKSYFGEKAGKKIFDLIPDQKKESGYYNLKLRIDPDNYQETLTKTLEMLQKEGVFKEK